MADLRNKQLSERYQTLITTSNISDTSPVVGALQNGQGAALTQVTLANGTASAPAYSFTADPDTGMFSSGTGLLDLVTAGSTALTINGNQLTVGLGSASAPSYSFIGDVNTGLFSSGADAIGLVTGGTSRLAIDSSGNVGIGGTATAKLDVHHADEDGLRFTTADGAQTFIDFGDASDNNIGSIRYDHADNHMRFLTNNAERIRMFSDGDISFMSVSQNRDFYWDAGNSRLGLGTSSPDYKLHLFDDTVTSSKKTLLQFDSNNIDNGGGYNIDFRTSSNDTANRFVARIQGAREGSGATSQLSFFTDDGSSLNQRMLINASGNVGIGTTSPSSILNLNTTGTSNFGLKLSRNDSATDGFEFTYTPSTAEAFIENKYPSSSGQVFGDIVFRHNVGGSQTERMRLEADGGDVIIQSANSTTTANDGGVGIVIKNTNNTDNNQGSLEFQNSGGTKTASIISTFIDHSTDEGALSFAVGDGGGTFAEAMRIDANGRVGIGVTSPSLALEVSDNNTNGVLGVKNTSNDRNTFKSSNAAGTRTLDIGNNSSGHGILNIRNSSGVVQTQIQGSGDSFFTGNIGMGTSSPENNLHISGTNSVAMTLQAPTHDSGVASTATMNFKYQSSGGSAIGKIELVEKTTNSFNGKFVFGLPHSSSGQATRDVLTIDTDGTILPSVSTATLGDSSNRFSQLFAAVATDVSSDKNVKQDFEQITEIEAKVAQKAKGLLKKYKLIKEVKAYGDDAQYHIGIIAQELIAAFEEEGLDYKKYAMISKYEHLEDSGEITIRYSVVYTELLAFIISTL